MAKRQSPICVVLFAFTAALAIQTVAAAFDVRYDGHAVLSCHMADEATAHAMNKEAKAQSLDIWSHSIKAGRSLHLQVPEAKRAFWEAQYGCTPMIEDVQEIIDQQFSHGAMMAGLWKQQGVETLIGEGEGVGDWYSQYHRFDEITRKTKSLADKYKDHTKFVKSIGKSHEGRDIPVIHMSSNLKENKPQIWINGGQHAREWIAPASVMYMTEHLLKDYTRHEELGESLVAKEETQERERLQSAKKIMDKFEFVVAPVINPDGYEYSFTGNRLWRKNRSKNKDGTRGVDLNRNWDNHWGEGGGSTRPSATDYQGPSVASEPEVKACQSYIKGLKHSVAGIDFHSYGELILRSKGWTKKPAKDESLLNTVGQDMESAISKKGGRGTKYKSETAAGLYPTTGSTDDWMSEQGKMWGHGWTVELPDSDRGGKGFLLPAAQINPASKEMYHGLLSFGENMAKQHDERKEMGATKWRELVHRRTQILLRNRRKAELGEGLDDSIDGLQEDMVELA